MSKEAGMKFNDENPTRTLAVKQMALNAAR
jgi:hypothetical protein